MKNPRFLFWFVIFLTIFSILVDMPSRFNISFDSPTLPLINKKISIHKEIKGFDLNSYLGSFTGKEFAFRRGLDLEGGVSVTLKADMREIPSSQRENALESAKIVIERRINLFGVSEPVIQKATVNGDYRIIVELPGVTDTNQAIRLIGTTAQLTFWDDSGASASAKNTSPSGLPLGITNLFQNPQKTDLTGNDLSETSVTFDQNTGKPQVQLVFTGEGAKKFAEITKRNVGKIVAIALDNQIIEAPRVNEPILNGNAVITGNFTTQTAKNLSIQLNAGALPVPLSILEQRTVGATLGSASLEKSLFAGILGFFVIVVFMIVLYGRLGFLASIALFLYTLFVLAIFKLSSLTPYGITLTLAGIAGLILSIGMAVDANILIFERMREELRAGKKEEVAIELGFTRAWTSIRDSNVSSLLTSAILYKFGTGPVRGFALTLALGVLVSMFSAIVITRTFLRMVYKKR